MMSKEAMRLALEALKVSVPVILGNFSRHSKAIAALEALAEQPAQQEPVAWMFQHGETGRTLCVDAQQVKWGFEERNPSYQKIAPLYTSPPAQRTWVGLTDEEKSELDAEYGDDTLAHLDAIEAKLKEKNT